MAWLNYWRAKPKQQDLEDFFQELREMEIRWALRNGTWTFEDIHYLWEKQCKNEQPALLS